VTPTSPDAIVQYILSLLTGSPTLPADLAGSDRILDNDLLPLAIEELPAIGVYLADDKFLSVKEDHGLDYRVATIRVEIRAVGPMLQGTATFRNWVKTSILQEPTLGGLVRSTTYASFAPFGVPSNVRLAGADLDFEATYLDYTEQING